MSDTETQLVEQLVTANRMLANEGIIDVFGHISVRSERNPQEFLLSCSRSPQAVTASDIMRYRLDGSPISETKERHYAERVIHAAILAVRPEINSVCHTHSDAVLPFAASGEQIRPVVHAGTLFWEGVGWFEKYDEGGNLLVASADEGRELASALGKRRAAVLKNHGCVLVGKSIPAAVMAAIHIEKNARVQLETLRFSKTFYIEGEEARRGAAVFDSPLSLERSWGYWLARLPHGWRADAGLENTIAGTH
jgi:ribulose-5-phosphate 4-epimerase/fuculose-1-phosphate aldolase